MSSFINEQYDIVSIDRWFRDYISREIISKDKKTNMFSYNRLLGDISCRIVAHYLSKHLPRGYKTVISAYIWNLPVEYDLLIVKACATPLMFHGIETTIYKPSDVAVVVEVKSRGIFPNGRGIKGLKKTLEKIVHNLKKPMTLNHNIKSALLIIGEVLPRSDSAINFVKETRRFMCRHEIPVFILSNIREKDVKKAVKPFEGEWKAFINYVVKTLSNF